MMPDVLQLSAPLAAFSLSFFVINAKIQEFHEEPTLGEIMKWVEI